ncbi:transglycosylase domain-containing protein [Cribrihabitans pelagius]|uniref:transglycosylase domain-containing protein n=1 Tax=Cribrihabitans pelagius TaxID=1765746 RepID=UPI003B59786D
MRRCTVILISLLTLAVPAKVWGEKAAGILSPADIQERYQEAADEWPEIPEWVLLAFAAPLDRRFFDKKPHFSRVTGTVTGWHVQPGAGRLQSYATAYIIGQALSHHQILTWHVNQVFLGQGCFGVSGAAMAYFGKTAEELTLGEAAYLAGLPIAPAVFHPFRSYERAVQRRNFALGEILKAGFIIKSEATAAMGKPLIVRDPLGTCGSRG